MNAEVKFLKQCAQQHITVSTIYLNNIYCVIQIKKLTSADSFAFPPALSASALVSLYLWEKVYGKIGSQLGSQYFFHIIVSKPFFVDDSLPLSFPLLCTALGQMFSLVKVDLDLNY